MEVKIYSREDCKFCRDAKEFLMGMEMQYVEINQPEGRVPQIYIDGQHIGGYTELLEWATLV